MRIAILSGILFLSGIGALIFETLWLRLSGLAFGNSVRAAALILSSFMAGLALGNAIAASSRIRRWRPLHLYAALGGGSLLDRDVRAARHRSGCGIGELHRCTHSIARRTK